MTGMGISGAPHCLLVEPSIDNENKNLQNRKSRVELKVIRKL
jgi:hypothetical protein